jgi:hypothetical protein
MPDGTENTVQRDPDVEIWSAIEAFEKILEVMPGDRSTLETLSHAYEHIGDQAKTLEYLLRLGDAIVADGDVEAAGYILQKIEGFENVGPDVQDACGRLRGLLQREEETAGRAPVGGVRAGVLSDGFRVADELSFAWKLLEAGELTQEEYAGVAQDLSEMSANEHLATVSVLHTLHTRAFSGMERLMGFVSRDSKTPIILLQSFDIASGAVHKLPLEFMIRRGAIVFDTLGDDALVTVMNPYDTELREQVRERVGQKCHFFMAQPEDFDAVISRAKEVPAPA